MKRFTAMVLAVILLLSFPACSKAEKEANPYRMKTWTSESYQDGKIIYYTYIMYYYDDNGFISHSSHFFDNKLTNTQIFERDPYGNILSTTSLDKDNKETKEVHILTLDEKNRVIRDESSYGSITEYAYDEAGNQTMLNINRVGALDGKDWISYMNNTYDKNGNLIRQDVRWEPQGDSGYTLYDYKGGKLVKETSYTTDGTLYGYAEYTYDESGLVQTRIDHKADGTPEYKLVTTSDKYGNILEKASYHYGATSYGDDNHIDSRVTFTYELIEQPE